MATTGGKRNNLPHSYTHLSVLARNIIILMKLARVSDKSRRSIPHMPKPTPSAWPEVVPDAWLTKRGGQLAKYFPWLTRPALAILDFFRLQPVELWFRFQFQFRVQIWFMQPWAGLRNDVNAMWPTPCTWCRDEPHTRTSGLAQNPLHNRWGSWSYFTPTGHTVLSSVLAVFICGRRAPGSGPSSITLGGCRGANSHLAQLAAEPWDMHWLADSPAYPIAIGRALSGN